MTFVYSQPVRFGDLDAMRHFNNVEFLRFFETARIEFLQHVFPLHDPGRPEQGFGLIFAECHVNYRSPGHYKDVVDTSVWVADVARSSFRVGFAMHVGDRLLAEGWGALVGFDYAAQQPMALPDDLRDTLLAHRDARSD